MSENIKILIITYYWPPSGGAGVQRWLKFSKYLPEFNFQPYILTVDPKYAQFPAYDNSLIEDINPKVRVYTTKARNYFKALFWKKEGAGKKNSAPVKNTYTKSKFARFIRGNLFIPDPRKGWNGFAFRKAVELIEEQNIEIIITSGPPHSSHLIGRRLKRKYNKIKWIADFRDPWTDIYYYSDFYSLALSRKKDKKYEYSVLTEADKILTVGEGMKALLESKLDPGVNKIFVLPNGFDEDDFQNKRIKDKKRPFTLTYSGSISERYPLESFLKAISGYINNNPGQKLSLSFVGQQSEGLIEQIKKYKLYDISTFVDYSSHMETINLIKASDMLLLIIPEHKHSNVIITGKIFEYMKSGNTILGIGPTEGDAAKILTDTGAGKMFDPGNIEGIGEYISENVYKNKNMTVKGLNKFERKNLTSTLVKLLDL